MFIGEPNFLFRASSIAEGSNPSHNSIEGGGGAGTFRIDWQFRIPGGELNYSWVPTTYLRVQGGRKPSFILL